MERELRLREALATQLERNGTLSRPSVARALRAVPRHRFIPSVALEEAYADCAIAIKVEGESVVSSISQPAMIVQMLELLSAAPAEHVLEVGTGSGYNAALLSELVGSSGRVTTIELDPEIARNAQETLRELGYGNVRVVIGDGAADVEAPGCDGLIVTARVDDLAAAWWQGLREGGRLVVPLRLEEAGEQAIGFERGRQRMSSIGIRPCAFIALREPAVEPAAADVFYRDPANRGVLSRDGTLQEVVAVRSADAAPEMLDAFDAIVMRPVTAFGLRFTRRPFG